MILIIIFSNSQIMIKTQKASTKKWESSKRRLTLKIPRNLRKNWIQSQIPILIQPLSISQCKRSQWFNKTSKMRSSIQLYSISSQCERKYKQNEKKEQKYHILLVFVFYWFYSIFLDFVYDFNCLFIPLVLGLMNWCFFLLFFIEVKLQFQCSSIQNQTTTLNTYLY